MTLAPTRQTPREQQKPSATYFRHKISFSQNWFRGCTEQSSQYLKYIRNLSAENVWPFRCYVRDFSKLKLGQAKLELSKLLRILRYQGDEKRN